MGDKSAKHRSDFILIVCLTVCYVAAVCYCLLGHGAPEHRVPPADCLQCLPHYVLLYCNWLLPSSAWMTKVQSSTLTSPSLFASLYFTVLQLAAACLGIGDQSAEYCPFITFLADFTMLKAAAIHLEHAETSHLLQLAAACLGMGDQSAEYRPPITFVVVQKRHHTRLFPTKPNEGDRSGNIMPGKFRQHLALCTCAAVRPE